ncbi:SDR family NAD(P)-dependent oxidoreductase [Streptomyces violaceusniger]|uniref:SDR family NAD(P)-dependent oxidoreductase n=1 Tax=Streptomyces violaceusniger TaxID=68280 RepID=UPI0010F50B10
MLTGASSGIGAAFAEALAARGATLVLVVRRAERLASMADALRRTTGARVEAIPADLSHPVAARDLHREVADRGLRVTSLINNAGSAFALFPGSDPGTDRRRYRRGRPGAGAADRGVPTPDRGRQQRLRHQSTRRRRGMNNIN